MDNVPPMDREGLREFLIAARKAVAEGKVIDMANAILQTAGDEDFLQEIVQDLLEEAIQHFANMRAAVPERNVQACRFNSHSIKGAAANLYAKQLQHSAAAIEHLCKLALAGKLSEADWVAGVTALMKLLSGAIQRFRAAAKDMFE